MRVCVCSVPLCASRAQQKSRRCRCVRRYIAEIEMNFETLHLIGLHGRRVCRGMGWKSWNHFVLATTTASVRYGSRDAHVARIRLRTQLCLSSPGHSLSSLSFFFPLSSTQCGLVTLQPLYISCQARVCFSLSVPRLLCSLGLFFYLLLLLLMLMLILLLLYAIFNASLSLMFFNCNIFAAICVCVYFYDIWYIWKKKNNEIVLRAN